MDSHIQQSIEDLHRHFKNAGSDALFRILPQKLTTKCYLYTRSIHGVIQEIQDPAHSLCNNAYTSRKKRKLSELCAHTENDGNLVGMDVINAPEARECLTPLNPKTLDMVLKRECDDLVQLMDDAKIWLVISSPSTSVAEFEDDILAEFHRAQESALNIRDSARKYYLERGKICSKLIKYPSVEDFKHALKEYDEQRVYLARQHLYDIRNIYVVLNEMIKRSLTVGT